MPKSNPSHWLSQAVNRGALVLAIFLGGVGSLRLLTALISGAPIPLRPVDGWLWMSLRVLAVLFSLVLFATSHLRQRHYFFVLALVLLTAAGLGLRLGSLLPLAWQPTAGAAQLVLSVGGLGLIIAGLVQGDDLALFLKETWSKGFMRSSMRPPGDPS
jgi:hypothetical protein